MDKQTLIYFLKEGKTHKEIAEIIGCSTSKVGYWIKKYDINNLSKNIKPNYKDINYFEKIDTKEKAYIVGFLLGDTTMSKQKIIQLSISKKDKEILEFIQSELGCNITYTEYKKGYPMGNITIGNNTLYNDLLDKFNNGRLKTQRYLRKIPLSLSKYVILGFLDADGTIYYKNTNNRLRLKVGFYSPKNILQSIQLLLFKNNYLFNIIPVSNKKMSRMVKGNKEIVYKFLNWLYDDLIVLKRKYKIAQEININILKN